MPILTSRSIGPDLLAAQTDLAIDHDPGEFLRFGYGSPLPVTARAAHGFSGQGGNNKGATGPSSA